jgi:uroporphyrinogen III methyltransferase/synthase
VRVVNTRSPRQAPELDVLLEERRARPLSYPCIDIAPALDPAPIDVALRRASGGAFDWLVFTSANAVEAVEARWPDLGIQPG